MTTEKDKKAIERIKTEIDKIDKKLSKICFFVLDTKGTPSGSLEYIYKLAYILNEEGYDVNMLYQAEKDDKFVGVSEWLYEKYANLKHFNINDEFEISPSDVLFIPEILPCKNTKSPFHNQ